MRMKFEYLEPRTLREALEMLKTHAGRAKLLAGGTDLLVKLKRGQLSTRYLINIKRIDQLKGIKVQDGVLSIGPLVTLSELINSNIIRSRFPILADAAQNMASAQIRTVATIGGNICNASPAADLAPPLLCLDARLTVQDQLEAREIQFTRFFKGPGENVLAPDQILTGISIPMDLSAYRGIFIKYGIRNALDISVISLAILEGKDKQDIRVGLGAVAPTPIRAYKTESLLRDLGEITLDTLEKAAELVVDEISPIDDIRASRWYREEITKVMLKRGLSRLAELSP
jgi:CO/xanthine dehydrogenase FAD-binding subunit